jgi:hypothetical protein
LLLHGRLPGPDTPEVRKKVDLKIATYGYDVNKGLQSILSILLFTRLLREGGGFGATYISNHSRSSI